MTAAHNALVFDPQIIRRFDVNGPRYTSYPTADRFVDSFDVDSCKHWLGHRAPGQSLSLYFHIPFCNTICYYCACNKIITKDHGRSAKYLKYLARELALQSRYLAAGDNEVTQLHWGGGTPTFLSHDEMRQLMAATRQHFRLVDDGEYSIQVDQYRSDLRFAEANSEWFLSDARPSDRRQPGSAVDLQLRAFAQPVQAAATHPRSRHADRRRTFADSGAGDQQTDRRWLR